MYGKVIYRFSVYKAVLLHLHIIWLLYVFFIDFKEFTVTGEGSRKSEGV